MQQDFMTGHAETGRDQLFDFRWAAFDLEDLAAGAAMKMVVMRFARALVARWLAREFDSGQPLLVDQILDAAIDGGDSESADVFGGSGQDLIGGERTSGLFDGFADGGALFCISSHFIRVQNEKGQAFRPAPSC